MTDVVERERVLLGTHLEVEALLPVEGQRVVELELQAGGRLLPAGAGGVVLPLLAGGAVGLGRGAPGGRSWSRGGGGEAWPCRGERQLRLQLHPLPEAEALGLLVVVELLHTEELGGHDDRG